MDLCHNEGKELCAAPLSNGICQLVGCNYDWLYQWSTTECEPGDANYPEGCEAGGGGGATSRPTLVPTPQPSVSPVPTTVSPYSEYIFVEEAVPWNEAVVYCETHYDHLATIRTPSEDAAAVAASLGKVAWIGLSGPPWTWSSGEVVGYTNWASPQPDGDGNCANVNCCQGTGHWNDYNCANGGYVKGFLCEQSVFAPAPSPVPTSAPTSRPSLMPTPEPSQMPTAIPSSRPSSLPTSAPTPHVTTALDHALCFSPACRLSDFVGSLNAELEMGAACTVGEGQCA